MATAHSIPAAHESFSDRQVQRFWKAVLKLPSGCWEWQKRLDPHGYGTFDANGKRWRAHRASWELTHQCPTPKGLIHDHLCRNRCCVNPEHLEPVTDRVNILRGAGAGAMHARQTHCVHGHPLFGDNLFIERGFRRCKACLVSHRQRSLARRRARFLASGLCAKCGEPSTSYRCERCRQKHAADGRKSKAKMKVRSRSPR